jgi:hypothetical protein
MRQAHARLALHRNLARRDRGLLLVSSTESMGGGGAGTPLGARLGPGGGAGCGGQAEPWQLSGALLRQCAAPSGARLDTSDVRGRMTFSLSLSRKTSHPKAGKARTRMCSSCAGTDRAKRAPYPRRQEKNDMRDVALLELLKWIVISSASRARLERVSIRRCGQMLEPRRERGRRESHGECRGVSPFVRGVA